MKTTTESKPSDRHWVFAAAGRLNPITRDGIDNRLWVVLAIGWAISTWIGLALVEAVYNGSAAGHLLDGILNRPDAIPIGFYKMMVWQLTTGGVMLCSLVILTINAMHVHKAALLISVLLGGDLMFIAASYAFGEKLSILDDANIPEFYQYFRLIIVTGACLYLWRNRQSSSIFAVFAALFGWLLIDDAFLYHELMGSYLTMHYDLGGIATIPGIRGQDIGEILSLGLTLGWALPLIVYGYFKSDLFARQVSRYILGLLALLGIFGVIIDVFGRMEYFEPIHDLVFHIEDGGEMLVISVLVAYLVPLTWSVSRD